MKKLLLATTMIVAGAASAHADVTLSGDARMGYANDDWAGTSGMSSRARVSFTLAGTSDAGISFGGSFRADNASNAAKGLAGTVFVSGAFGKISMGNQDPADYAIVGDVSGVGYTGLSDMNETYNTLLADINWSDVTDAVRLNYDYTAGDLTVGASYLNSDYDAYALAVAYTFGNYVVAVGYGDDNYDNDNATWSTKVTATFGDLTLKAKYANVDSYYDQTAVSADYKVGATTLTGFWTNQAGYGQSDGDTWNETATGIGVAYDLGGGATLKAGYVHSNEYYEGSNDAYDLGITFKF